MPRFLFRSISVQSEVFVLSAAKQILLSDLRVWCRWWEQCFRKLVILHVRVYSKASHSTISYLNNSNVMAKTPEKQLLCNCAHPLGNQLRKLCGCVCQPLIPWLRHHYALPKEWNGKARLVPSFDNVMKPWEECLEKLRDKMTLQFFGPNSSWHVPKIPCTRNKVHGLYLHKMIPSRDTVSESHLAGIRKELRSLFAITPVDKLSPDGIIL